MEPTKAAISWQQTEGRNRMNQLGKPPIANGIHDAVHVAIIAVTAHRQLKGGERISVRADHDGYQSDEISYATQAIATVDPEVVTVGRGCLFWALLPSSSTVNLRHDWSHSGLPVVEKKETASLWPSGEDDDDDRGGCCS